MFGKLGVWELVLILVIVLVIFGPRKLPEIGKSLGRGLREFKNATTGMFKNDSGESSGEKKAADGSQQQEGETKPAQEPSGKPH